MIYQFNITSFLQWVILLTGLVSNIHTLASVQGIISDKGHQESTTTIQSFTTVIDLLSQDVEFSIFVRLLQRKKLIPYLNELQNFTLFAPVNSAFVHDSQTEESPLNPDFWPEFDIENYLIHNSVITTDQLINRTRIITSDVKYPIVLNQAKPNSDDFYINNDIRLVETNLTPNMQNATLHAVESLISDAGNPLDVVQNVNDFRVSYGDMVSLLENLLKRTDYQTKLNNKTLLVPSNKSFKTHFNPIELNYLLNQYDKLDSMEPSIQRHWYNDMQLLIKNLIIDDVIGGSTDLITVNENNDIIHIGNENMGQNLIINGEDSTVSRLTNQPFDFGMAHFFDEISFLNKSITFDAEKYLHGLNCSGFVREIYFRGLEKFIHDHTGENNITIFLPQASVNDEVGFTKSTLLYHFTEDQIWLENEFPTLNQREIFNRFYNSSFCSSNKKLGGNCQRMKITKSNRGYHINSKFKILNSKPYSIGNTLIYIIDNDLSLPNELIFSIPPTLDTCSKSISFLRRLNYLDLKSNHEGYTVFLPCFDSWDNMGLNYKYLQSNLTATNLIMQNLIVKGLYYTDLNDHKYMETTNIADDPVILDINKDSQSSEISVNFNLLQNNLTIEKDSDIIFNQGVIHPTHNIEYPFDLQITLKDLFMTSGNEKFLYLLETLPHFKHLFQESKTPYSILVPTLSSLDYANINLNYTKLQEFLKLHIIPGNETMNLLNCNSGFSTMLGENLECHSYSQDDQYIRIKDGASNEVRILNKGCSTINSQQACIFLIDKPISLNWIGRDKYNLNMPILAIAFGVILGVVMFMIFLCCLLVVRVKNIRNRYDSVDSTDSNNNIVQNIPVQHDTESKNPLLHNQSGRSPSYDSTSYSSRNIDHSDRPMTQESSNSTKPRTSGSHAYSTNSISTPIEMPRR